MARLALAEDVVIDRLKNIYGESLDFSNVVYKNRREKVQVTCHKHGTFTKSTDTLLGGSGCPQCGHDARGKKSKLSQGRVSLTLEVKENFIRVLAEQKRSMLSTYENCKTHVTIMCSNGHVVSQAPYSVLAHGRGCSLCKKHWDGYNHVVYVMYDSATGLVKIGKTKSLRQRINQLRKHTESLELVDAFTFGNGDNQSALTAERHAHEYFKDSNACLSGFPGSTELFKITSQDAIDYLQSQGGISMVINE